MVIIGARCPACRRARRTNFLKMETETMMTMKNIARLLLTVMIVGACIATHAPAAEVKGPVKVFILAGQSNMVGKGFPEPLSWQITQEKYRERYTHFIKDGDYDAFAKKIAETVDPSLPWNKRQKPTYLWSTRSDVWVSYGEDYGDLTVGYGGGHDMFGPEYNFGHVMGDHYDEQVLVIKTAWGGRALARGFMPPSSMLSDKEYAKLAAEQNMSTEEYKAQFGKDYRAMVEEVKTCLASLSERFPGYDDQGYEIVGFVWFQGWNDQYSDRWLSYEKNLANLIRDMRKEFGVPKMPVVVGQMGHDGLNPDKEGSPRDYIKKAQAAVPASAEFKGTALCVKTDKFWDLDAHAIITGPGGWSADVAKWRQFGNDHGYHYYGSPWTFAQIGTAFGEGMIELLK